MNEALFKSRTKHLRLRVIRLVESLPNTTSASVIGKQIVRSATSVAANYRAACRAKSTADILNKLKIVEEADETLYWQELFVESGLVSHQRVVGLMTETNEIIAMVVASIKTLRSRSKHPSNNTPSNRKS